MAIQKRAERLISTEKRDIGAGMIVTAEYRQDCSFVAWVKTHDKNGQRVNRMVRDFTYHCGVANLLFSEEEATRIAPNGTLTAFRVIGSAEECFAFRRAVLFNAVPSVASTEDDIPLRGGHYANPNWTHGKRHASMDNQKGLKRAAHGAGLGAVSTVAPIRLVHSK